MTETRSPAAILIRRPARRRFGHGFSGRIAGMAAFAVAASAAPGVAHAGFFEQLFGLQPPPAAEQPAFPQPSFEPRARLAPRAPRKHVVVEAIGDGRQTPTDLMHDKTLRRGDAVMMKDGMHVYAGGSRSATHAAGEFVRLDNSGLPAKDRSALAAIDATRIVIVDKDGGAAGTLASGRSVAVAAPIAGGILITDARGSRIRYVGP